MQDLIILKDTTAIVQSNGKVYTDTYENFLQDYGELPKTDVTRPLTFEELSEKYRFRHSTPDDVNTVTENVNITAIDYNRETASCWLNGYAFQPYPNEVCESILNSIDTIIAAKEAREHVEPTLDELKAAKLAEVDAWTAAKITGGFVSSATGAPVTYDSDKDTQLTVASDLNTINLAPEIFSEKFPGGYPMRGYPAGTDTSDKNNKVIYYLTKEQLLQWNVDIGLHRGACKQAGWDKQKKVNAAQSKEDLDKIVLN